MEDYGTEVQLLAVTGLMGTPDFGFPPSGQEEGEWLIEYAGRLCYNMEDKTGSRPGWIQDRVKDGHESILEHASATFYIKASRVFTHQLVRHRIASYSQRSQRYVKEDEPKYITPPELDGVVGSFFSGSLSEKTLAVKAFIRHMENCWLLYGRFLEAGVPKEIARYVLPNACETQIVTTMNFRELRHFIKLRTSSRALPEMREVANRVRDLCKEIAPEVFEDI